MRQVVAAGGDTGVLVPVEAVAGHRIGVTGAAVVDGQVQDYYGVAASRVGEGV